MKKCPNCNQTFEDDNVFCVIDGAVLVSVFEVSQSRLVVSWENNPPTPELPTQVVPLSKPSAGIPKENSKFLYAVIGALVAIILAMGVGFVFLRNTTEKETARTDSQAEKSKNENNSADSFPSNQNAVPPTNTASKSKEKIIPKADANSNNRLSDNANSANTYFPLTRNFNRTYRGTADDDGITMQLKRSGSSLGGRVFSRRSVTEISVSGGIDNDGYFEMSEYSDVGVVTGVYQGRINSDGTMTGTWAKPDGSKPRDFFLRTN